MLADRDRCIIDWIGRLGAASATDVTAQFGMGGRAAGWSSRSATAPRLWPRTPLPGPSIVSEPLR